MCISISQSSLLYLHQNQNLHTPLVTPGFANDSKRFTQAINNTILHGTYTKCQLNTFFQNLYTQLCL